MLWIVFVGGYMTMIPFVFWGASRFTRRPDFPWDSPAPFLGALFWPIALPFIAGTLMCQYQAVGRKESKRIKELEEAKHKVELARLRAEETAQLERALK